MSNIRTIFEGRILKLNQETTTLPNGRQCTQEIIRHPGGACVLPIFENGDVLLIRQFRYATGGYIWEVPAGKLDFKGEDPKDCVRRELVEETGHTAEKIEKINHFFTAPGFCDEVLHLFKATGLKPCPANPEEHEVIEAHRLTPSQVKEMLKKGDIVDAKTLIALYSSGTFLGL